MHILFECYKLFFLYIFFLALYGSVHLRGKSEITLTKLCITTCRTLYIGLKIMQRSHLSCAASMEPDPTGTRLNMWHSSDKAAPASVFTRVTAAHVHARRSGHHSEPAAWSAAESEVPAHTSFQHFLRDWLRIFFRSSAFDIIFVGCVVFAGTIGLSALLLEDIFSRYYLTKESDNVVTGVDLDSAYSSYQLIETILRTIFILFGLEIVTMVLMVL